MMRSLGIALAVIAALAVALFGITQRTMNSKAERAVTERLALPAAGGPYVYVLPGHVFNLKQGTLQGYVGIQNAGNAHARVTDWWMGIRVTDATPPPSLTDFGTMTMETGALVLPPSSTSLTYRNYVPLSEEQSLAVRAGKERVYVFGHAGYEGSDGTRHVTTFCYVYSGPEVSNRHDGYDSVQARRCPDKRHNEVK